MRPNAIRQVVTILLAMPGATSARPQFPVAARALAGYECEIRLTGPRQAHLLATIRLSPAHFLGETSFTIVRYPGQQITGIRLTDEQGNPVSAGVVPAAAMLEIQAGSATNGTESAGVVRVEYQIESSAARLSRIPLPVPDARSAPGWQAVRISVALPARAIPLGDDFPALVWQGVTRGEARLSDVPSLALVEWKPQGPATLLDTLLASPALTDAGMVLILLAGTAIWLLRRRRARLAREFTRAGG